MGDAPDFGSRTDFYTFSPESLASELPDYEIVSEVGKGSMGIVFEARRKSDGERVALKVLPPSLTLTERTLARFLREGDLLSKVRHPAIVQAYEHGRGGRLHYFAMEFVPGTTLEERVRLGPLPVRDALELAAQVGRALHFAHERGVLHRDIKPGNLMLREDGRVAITDFGLARETGTGSMTESGTLVGTPMYMAPEQVVGDRGEIGTRSDVYGLGAALYHLLTGEPPFQGPTAQAVLKAVLDEDPPLPRRRRADLPLEVEAIVLEAMEKDPAHRYGTALEMAEDIERHLRGERVLARRPGPVRRAYRVTRRHPLATALAVAVLVLAVGAFALWQNLRHDRLNGRVQEASEQIALAAGLRDAQLRQLSPEQRQQHLLRAVGITSEVIAEDPGHAPAWFVRAQARHRLQRYRQALDDLDEAERRRGSAGLDILLYRIDTLRRLPGAAAQTRLLDDLRTLLATDPGPTNRGLVAEYLVDLAGDAPVEVEVILDRAARVLEGLVESDPRAAVAHARLLELRGRRGDAERTMEQARIRFRGNPLVHYRAAEMFARLGKEEQSEDEVQLARMLDPLGWPEEEGGPPAATESAASQSLDVDELESFLNHLDSLMRALGPPDK